MNDLFLEAFKVYTGNNCSQLESLVPNAEYENLINSIKCIVNCDLFKCSTWNQEIDRIFKTNLELLSIQW